MGCTYCNVWLSVDRVPYLNSKDEVVETEYWLSGSTLSPQLGTVMQTMDHVWSIAKHVSITMWSVDLNEWSITTYFQISM